MARNPDPFSVLDDTPLREAQQQEAQAAGLVNQQAAAQDIIQQETQKHRTAEREIASAESDARQAQAAIARQNKAQVEAAKKAGVEIDVDPATGGESIRRRDDGSPVWQAGFQGGLTAGDDGQHSATYRDPTGKRYRVPLTSIDRTEDGTGTAFYEFDLPDQNGQKQRIRRPEDTKAPLFKVDKATGRRYAEAPDPVTGGMIQQPLGMDPRAANAVAIERRKGEHKQAEAAWTFEEQNLAAQIGLEKQQFEPVQAKYKELEKQAKEFETGTRYEQRQDGMYEVSKDDIAIRISDIPERLVKAEAWLAEKKRVTEALAQTKTEHDPMAQSIQAKEVEKAKLGLRTLNEGHRMQVDIARMEEAAKAGQPVWETETQKRLASVAKDPRFANALTEGRLADEGSPLLPDVQQAQRVPVLDTIGASLGDALAPLPDANAIGSNLDGSALNESAQERTLAEVLKTAPQSQAYPDADTAAKDLGIDRPEDFVVTPTEAGPALTRIGSGETTAFIDVKNNRLLMTYGELTSTDSGQAMGRNSKVPIYVMGGAQPFNAQQRRDYLAGAVQAMMSGSDEAVITAGGDIPSILRNVKEGRLSVQDGQWLQEKLHGIGSDDLSFSAVERKLEDYAKGSVIENRLWQGPTATKETRAEVVNRYMDNLSSRASAQVLYAGPQLEALRENMLKKKAGKSQVQTFSVDLADSVKNVFGSIPGLFASAGERWLEFQTPGWGIGQRSERSKLFWEQTANWNHEAAGMPNRVFGGEKALREAFQPLREWAASARPGDAPPPEQVENLKRVAFEQFHAYSDPADAASRNTTLDTFDITKGPLGDGWNEYMQTRSLTALNSVFRMLMMDEDTRNLQQRANAYITAPRRATVSDVQDRAAAMNLNLNDGQAKELLRVAQSPITDEAMGKRALKHLSKILDMPEPDALLALDLFTREAGYAPNSLIGYMRGGLIAPGQELALEAVSTYLGFKGTQLAARGAMAIGKEATIATTRRAALGQWLARTAAVTADDFERMGMFATKFGKPLSKAQRLWNTGMAGTKAVAGDALTEGIEEGISAIGEPGSNIDTVLESAAQGALAAPVMVSGMAVLALPGEVIGARRAKADWETKKATYLASINDRLSAIPGTPPFTPEEFEQALMLYGSNAAAQVNSDVATAYDSYVATLQASPKQEDGSVTLTPETMEAQQQLGRAVALAEAREALVINAALELRELPEQQRQLFTAVAKVQMGLNQFTVPESQALLRLSGANQVRFVPEPTPAAPPQQSNALPSVTLLPGGRMMLAPGAVPVLPAAILTEAAQAAPSLGQLMQVTPAPQAPAQAENTIPPTPATEAAQSAPKKGTSAKPQDRGRTAEAAAVTTPGVTDKAQGVAEATLADATPAIPLKNAPGAQAVTLPDGQIEYTWTGKGRADYAAREGAAKGMKVTAVESRTGPDGEAVHVVRFQPPAPAPKTTELQRAQVTNTTRRVIGQTLARSPALKKLVKEQKQPPAQATGGMWIAEDGLIAYHMDTLVEQLGPLNLSASQLAKRINSILDEEVRHVANIEASRRLWEAEGKPWDYETWRDAWYADIWKNQFTEEMRQAVIQAYGDALPDAPWVRAMEGLRMLDQLRATDSITEAVLRHLEAVVQFLRDTLQDLTPTIKRELEAMQTILQEFGYEAGKVPPEKAEKPARKAKKKPAPEVAPAESSQPEVSKPEVPKSGASDAAISQARAAFEGLASAPAGSEGGVDNTRPNEQTTGDETARTNSDGSGNSRNLLEAAARIGGKNAPVYFGPESTAKLAEVREKELSALTQEPEAPAPPSESPDFEGGEHTVYVQPDEGQVLKYTLDGFYGRFIHEVKLFDQRTFLNRPKLTLRGALPSEYLRRWAVMSDIFGFDTTYLGQRPGEAPRMAVSQPYIEQAIDEGTQADDAPEIEDVNAFMEAHGFTKVAPESIAIPEIADVTWYRQRDGILITDAHARNFRKEASTQGIVPIDLMITTVPKGQSKILPDPETQWGMDSTEGLASAPAPAIEQVSIPNERLPAFRALAETLKAEQITTPEALASFLNELRADGSLQKYSQGLLDLINEPAATVEGAVEATAPQEPEAAPAEPPADGTVVSYEGHVGRIQKAGQRWEIESPSRVVEVTSEQLADVKADVTPEERGNLILDEINAAREKFIKQIAETSVNLWPAEFRPSGDGSLTITDHNGNAYKPQNERLSRSVKVENGRPMLLLQRLDQPGRIIRLTGQHALKATDALLNAAANVEAAGGKVRLASSPAPAPDGATNAQRLRDALAQMPPIWRSVLQESMTGVPVERIAENHSITTNAVGNILRVASGRLTILLQASKGSLKPTVQVEDQRVKATSGDAALSMGANPAFVAVDQRRGRPEEVTHGEMQDLAQRLFTLDPVSAEKLVTRWMDSGTTVLSVEDMPDGIRAIVNDAQARQAAEMLMTAAAKLLVTEKSLAGGDAYEIARLIDLYRTTGTEQARALNMRFDPHQKPEQRAAMFISEALLTPPSSLRDQIRRNPANKERILREWSAKAQEIKEQLKGAGYDIDATFESFRREQAAAEATVPAEVRTPLNRAPGPVRALVRAILEGRTWREAADAGKMTLEQARQNYNLFRQSVNEAATQAARAATEAMLSSAPAADFASQIGLPEWTDAALPDESPVQTAATEALERERRRKGAAGEIDLTNPVDVARATNALMPFKSATFDKLSEFWRASILSGPQTHVVNIFSGLAFGTYEATVKKMAAGTLADIGRLFGMQTDAASLADIPAMLSATVPALKRAFADAIRAWKAETSFFNAYALDEGRNGPMVKGEAFEPALKGPVGKIMRGISFRLMLLADEFVKSFFTRIEVAAQARQIARAEGLTGGAMARKIQELLIPGSEAWVRGLDNALKITFQTELGTQAGILDQIDGIANGVQRAKNGDFGMIAKGLSHFVFPFVSTPTNIFKMGVQMSPLGTFLSLIDAARALNEQRKGNAEEAARIFNAARLFNDLVNQIVAWGTVFAVSSLVQPGEDEDSLPFITGSLPWKATSQGERELAYRTAPPTSIRIGDRWFSYGRLDPFASSLAFIVDSVKEFQKGSPMDETWGRIGIQMLTTMQDKTFLQGFSDLMNAVQNPERFGTRWATNIATGFVPNLIRQPIRAADEQIRDNDLPNDMAFWDVLGHRLGYSVIPQLAPMAIDVWGRPQVKGSGTGSPQTDFLYRLFSPVQTRDVSSVDPLDLSLLRYNMTADKPFGLTAPDGEFSRTVNGVTQKASLSALEREQYAMRVGQATRMALGSRFHRDLSTEDIEQMDKIIQKLRSMYRENQKSRLFSTAAQ